MKRNLFFFLAWGFGMSEAMQSRSIEKYASIAIDNWEEVHIAYPSPVGDSRGLM